MNDFDKRVSVCNSDELISSIQMSFDHLPSSDDENDVVIVDKKMSQVIRDFTLSKSLHESEKPGQIVLRKSQSNGDVREKQTDQICDKKARAAKLLKHLQDLIEDEDNLLALKAIGDLRRVLGLGLDDQNEIVKHDEHPQAEITERFDDEVANRHPVSVQGHELNVTYDVTTRESELKKHDSTDDYESKKFDDSVLNQKVTKKILNNQKINDKENIKMEERKSPNLQLISSSPKPKFLYKSPNSAEATSIRQSSSTKKILLSSINYVTSRKKINDEKKCINGKLGINTLKSNAKRGKLVDKTNAIDANGNLTYTITRISNEVTQNDFQNSKSTPVIQPLVKISKNRVVSKESTHVLQSHTSSNQKRPLVWKKKIINSTLDHSQTQPKKQQMKLKIQPSLMKIQVPDYSLEDLRTARTVGASVANSKVQPKTKTDVNKSKRRLALGPLDLEKLAYNTKKTVNKFTTGYPNPIAEKENRF